MPLYTFMRIPNKRFGPDGHHFQLLAGDDKSVISKFFKHGDKSDLLHGEYECEVNELLTDFVEKLLDYNMEHKIDAYRDCYTHVWRWIPPKLMDDLMVIMKISRTAWGLSAPTESYDVKPASLGK